MSSKRIAINTMATYGRLVLAMGMALFSSRWVLHSLGQSDFGLYSVVARCAVVRACLLIVLAMTLVVLFLRNSQCFATSLDCFWCSLPVEAESPDPFGGYGMNNACQIVLHRLSTALETI